MPRTILSKDPVVIKPVLNPDKCKVVRQVVRMPDGTKEETDIIVASVGTVQAWIAKSTVDYKPKKRKPTLMNHGFTKGEYGIYLPVPRVWLINRTENSVLGILKAIHAWREFALGGRPDVAIQCITDMVGAGNPKDAKAMRSKFVDFHGMWQVGDNLHTRMKGREALVRHMETLKKLKRCPLEATDADIKMAWQHDG